MLRKARRGSTPLVESTPTSSLDLDEGYQPATASPATSSTSNKKFSFFHYPTPASPANDLTNANSTPLAESPAAGANSVFSFRKSSIAAIRSTLRRGSLAVAGGGTKAAEKDPASANIVPKVGTKRAMRQKFCAAKLALRKISYSSIASKQSATNNSSPRTPGSGSIGSECGLLGPLASLGADSSDESARSAAPELVARVDEEEVISPTQKKPLGPSLSWDPEKRSRSPSTTSRSRIQSDGKGIIKCNKLNRQLETSSDHNLLDNGHSANNPRRRKSSCYSTNSPRLYKKSSMDSDTALYDRLELEKSCLHCSIGADYRRQQLKAEIENAVKRLSRRLDNRRPSSSWPRVDELPQDGSSLNSCEQIRRSMGTPDIVVSSFSSDDDPHVHCPSPVDFGFAGSVGSPSAMSITSPGPKANDLKFNFGSEVSSPRSSIASPFFGDGEVVSPMSPRDDAATPISPFYDSLETASPGGKPSNLLKPPGYTLPTGVVLTVEGAKQLRAAGDSGVGSSNSPPRSNSIDLSTLRRDIELFSVSSGETTDMGSDNECEPATPAESVRTVRSRSHDPSQSPDHLLRRPSRIEHLSEIFRKALAKSPVVKRAAAMQEQEQKRVCKHRTSRYWLEEIDPHEHIWLPSSGPGSTSNSTDTECYIGEKDCEKVGDKRRCAACHIVAHTACFPLLSKMNLVCKTTFRDCAANSSYRHLSKENWDALNKHHWVHRWKMEGRCHQCGKSYQQKMFRDKEVIAITCSWCKKSYHNKRSCFSSACFEEKCDRGALREMMLPPSWMLRLSNSRKRHASKNGCSAKGSMGSKGVVIASLPAKKQRRKYRPFVVKSMDQSIIGPTQPLLVFVNPKSGGNKGSKALHTLCWLLNPRQVFDITAMKGPKWGLEVFRKISTQLRILVCGGDGTVGWVLSTLDQLNWPTYPPMALLPLGTGNDLSRCMGWGGMFSDEPLAELLGAILTETSVTYLDRWRLDVQPNTSNAAVVDSSNDEQLSESVRQESSLPLTVMNNYFSIGADAHVALQFHHSRSANPQMLNSRLKNRIAYGGLGTIDLFKRTWKDLSEFLTIECDDVDITSKIRDNKFHCVLFHNISFYAGGTMPWGSDSGDEYSKPSCCDQKIEVIGFTTATLAALQMGAKGERIAQCSKVRIESTKAIPMQVDGEPCLLAPSIIKLYFHSKVPMLRRDKKVLITPQSGRRVHSKTSRAGIDFNASNTSVFMHVPVIVVGRHDYDTYRDCIDRLKDTAFEVGVVSVEAEIDLLNARQLIHKLLMDHPMLPYEPGKEWRFLDYISNSEEGIFRISRHHEHNHSISDICNLDECVIILDEAFPSMTARSAQIAHDLSFTPANQPAKKNSDVVAKSKHSWSLSCPQPKRWITNRYFNKYLMSLRDVPRL